MVYLLYGPRNSARKWWRILPFRATKLCKTPGLDRVKQTMFPHFRAMMALKSKAIIKSFRLKLREVTHICIKFVVLPKLNIVSLAQFIKLRLGASRSRSVGRLVGLSVFQTRFQTSCPNRVSKQALHIVSKQNTRKHQYFFSCILCFVWKLYAKLVWKPCLDSLFGISFGRNFTTTL